MTKTILYTELINHKDDIRARFAQIMYLEPKPLHLIALDVPVAPLTLRNFVNDGKIATTFTLSKIYSFVLKKEKELGE